MAIYSLHTWRIEFMRSLRQHTTIRKDVSCRTENIAIPPENPDSKPFFGHQPIWQAMRAARDGSRRPWGNQMLVRKQGRIIFRQLTKYPICILTFSVGMRLKPPLA